MTKAQVSIHLATLAAIYEAARRQQAAASTRATRQVVVDASAALSAAVMQLDPPKARGYACRAGRRQHAEMRALMARRSR